MAKFVIAGCADCPYYARAELLGDRLVKNLPDFSVHKIVKTQSEWDSWLEETCNQRGWTASKSPLVWRELLDRGGKGVLIGGANEFQEYVDGYYGVHSDLTSYDMRKIAEENNKMKAELDREMAEFKAQSKPLQICVSNASHPVCYHFINSFSSGEAFGSSYEIALRLFDENEDNSELLAGVKMETEDLSEKLLREVKVTHDSREAFKNCDFIILLDEIWQKENETKQDWLKRNVEHYVQYAKIINDLAKKNVKVLLAGIGPLNLCATMMIKNAPNLYRQNIVAMSRMVENYAKSVLGSKLNVNVSSVLDLIIWGNIHGKKYVDLSNCRVSNYDGAIWGPPSYTIPVLNMIYDSKWIEGEFIEVMVNRKAKVTEALNRQPAISLASAITSMISHWLNGSPLGQMFSLGVCSEGWYGVPEGLVFSFPVTMHPKGYWNVVQDLNTSKEMEDKLNNAIEDIVSEKNLLTAPPEPIPPQMSESQQQAGYSVLLETQISGEKMVFGLEQVESGDTLETKESTTENADDGANVKEDEIINQTEETKTELEETKEEPEETKEEPEETKVESEAKITDE